MKKLVGLFLLLFAFLLVAMPAVAADFESVNAWLIPGVSETESFVQEEVTVISDGEYMADLSVDSYTVPGVSESVIINFTKDEGPCNTILTAGSIIGLEVIAPRGGLQAG